MQCKGLCTTASRLGGIAGVHVRPGPVRPTRGETGKVMEREWNGDASVNQALERSCAGDAGIVQGHGHT
jgi:hypothetical protein